MAKQFSSYIMPALAAVLISSCSSRPPHSGGKPFDVVIITNDDASGRIVMNEMSRCTEYYTAEEKMFNLALTKDNGAEDAVRLARTLIIADTADVKHTIAIREKNMWAAPQLVLSIQTPSARQLADDFNELRELLAREINDFEREITLNALKHKRNMLLEDSVMKYTGTSIYVPATMRIARKADGFIWLTAYDADENQSLCIYRTHKRNVDVLSMPSVTHLRDSMMQKHIAGADDSTEWHICIGSESAVTRHDTVIVHNRWEMKGDAMGGPSACRIMAKGDSVTFIEAFLYAPASAKHIKMQKLEGILYSAGRK